MSAGTTREATVSITDDDEPQDNNSESDFGWGL